VTPQIIKKQQISYDEIVSLQAQKMQQNRSMPKLHPRSCWEGLLRSSKLPII